MVTNHPLATDNALGKCFVGQGRLSGKTDALREHTHVPMFCSFSPLHSRFLATAITSAQHCSPPQAPATALHCLPAHAEAIKSKQTAVPCQSKFGGTKSSFISQKHTENMRHTYRAH